MVHESPYHKALSMTSIMTIMGFIFTTSGFSQMASFGYPNWFLLYFGAGVFVVGAFLLFLVLKYGKKYFSTIGYVGGKAFYDVGQHEF